VSSPSQGDFGGLIDVGGGRHIYLECRGAGGPTVVLEAGYRSSAKVSSLPPQPAKVPALASPDATNRLRLQNACNSDRVPTGGAGFVGSHACNATSHAGYLPVTLDITGQAGRGPEA
jgi:hypothetical protein